MIRLIVYAVLGFVLWRILQSVGRMFTADRPKQAPPKAESRPRSAGPDLSKIQDAEFEDVTPKRDGAKTPGSSTP